MKLINHSFHVAVCALAFCGVIIAGCCSPSLAAPIAPDAAVVARLRADLAQLTSSPSRVPGTPGNLKAADYVSSRFKEIGLERVRAEEYLVTAPVTKFASLEVGGQTLQVMPLYPNHVVPASTPPSGIKGALVYGGRGRPKDFNGQKIEGAIVVLDFNSGLNWITAADLGARAIIFLAPTDTSRGEAERKFANMPVEVPRFYAPTATANAILQSIGLGTLRQSASSAPAFYDGHVKWRKGASYVPPVAPDFTKQKPVQATLKSRVVWERVKARNVLGQIRGTDANLAKGPGGTIIISAYYDSMAVTPDLAPGAEAAGNCAALLEVARYFKANPARYNLLFVANGAHHISLAGMRNFAAQHFIDSTGKADKAVLADIARYRAFVGLDLTSRTDTVGLFGKSWFYNQMTAASENILLNQFFDFANNVYGFAEAEAKRRGVKVNEFFADGITGREGRTWRSFLPSLVALDSEVATMAQKPGVSFATANDARAYQDTPLDTVNRVNLDNLTRQISTVTTLLDKSLNQTFKAKGKGNARYIMERLPASSTTYPATNSSFSPNFGYAVGRAIYRNVRKVSSFLPDSPLPDSSVPSSVAELPAGQREGVTAVAYVMDRATQYKSYSGVRGAFIERAVIAKASSSQPPIVQFTFLGPRVGDPKGGGAPPQEIEAYSVNGSGHVIYAPDMGSERQRFSPVFTTSTPTLTYKNAATGEYNVNASVICFGCRASTLLDALDQRYFNVLKEMTVLDAGTDATPVEYGFLRPMAAPGNSDLEPVGIVFAKPGARYKLIMAAGLLGKRLVVLQTDPQIGKLAGTTLPEGVGVVVPDLADESNRVVRVSYQVARDLWTLNQDRIHILKSFGINNKRVDDLHSQAGGVASEAVAAPPGADPQIEDPDDATKKITVKSALKDADEALAAMQYDKFYSAARRAFGLESRAYPDVEATSQDVLKGIIFYLALLLPFSFFLERLITGYPDVRKQIIGTTVAFLFVFTCLRYVHPAFELALTPFIILLAFIILALTVIVTIFLSSKFEQEIKRLKEGVHFADVGRLSAISAALGLGIANMRRRPTRTALTCVTLILLTFTVLSFTSVTANITNFARDYGDSSKPPAYAGLMVRQADWSAIEEPAVTSMRNEFEQRFGAVALRSWYLSRDQGEILYLRVNNAQNPSQNFDAPALMGVTPEEETIGSPLSKTLIGANSRWFRAGDTNVCLLPRYVLLNAQERAQDAANDAAAQAGSTAKTATGNEDEVQGSLIGLTMDNAVGSTIQVAGQEMEVIGIFDNRQFDKLRDLDYEEFAPVNYQNESNKMVSAATGVAGQKGQEAQVQKYQHMEANALLLLPYQTAIDLGGTTRSLAAGFSGTATPKRELNDLMQRAALGIFGATKDDKTGKLQSKLYSSVESTSYEGFAALLVPILIAALIIANTMLGSVYERTREIGIYSAVGLAPIHVAALFIAEALVYAVLGSISGYLIAQIVAKIVTANNWLSGITLNYSSSSAVIATLIVMATVLLSTLYPAWAASRLSQPDSNRRQDVSVPIGDLWRIQFPFTVSGQQPVGVGQFLADYFQTHTDTSVGKFYTDRVVFSSLSLRTAIDLLNEGVPESATGSTPGGAHASAGVPAIQSGTPQGAVATPPAAAPVSEPEITKRLSLNNIAADPETEVYRLSLRVWLAPFDMGVSQDTDIFLIPSEEAGLYELQLKLQRQSGEISAWMRVNRQFIADMRKQLLLWRTITPAGQHEYVLTGRALMTGQAVPLEVPGAVVSAA